MNSDKDYYQTLEVREDASTEVIKMAYKALALKYHPDRYKGDSHFAKVQMQIINEAYEILSDSIKRRLYDSYLDSIRKKGTTTENTSNEKANENEYRDTKYADNMNATPSDTKATQPQEDILGKKKRVETKKIISGMVSIVVIIAIIFFANINSSYGKAIDLMDTGKYEDATKAFNEISWYKDSNDLSIECKYRLGVSHYLDNEFQQAYNIFYKLSGYRDSGEFTLKSKYELALVCFNQNNYKKAADLFKSLKNYRDSPEKHIACTNLLNITSDEKNNKTIIVNADTNTNKELTVDNNWSGTWEQNITLDDGTKDTSTFVFNLDNKTITWDTEQNELPYVYPIKVISPNSIEFYQSNSKTPTDKCVFNSDGTIIRTYYDSGQTYLLTRIKQSNFDKWNGVYNVYYQSEENGEFTYDEDETYTFNTTNMSVLRICKNVSWSETGNYSYYGTITNVDNNILEWHYDLTPEYTLKCYIQKDGSIIMKDDETRNPGFYWVDNLVKN